MPDMTVFPQPAARVLIMRYQVNGELRTIVRDHEEKTPGRVIDEAARHLVGIYGLDPTSVRFEWEDRE